MYTCFGVVFIVVSPPAAAGCIFEYTFAFGRLTLNPFSLKLFRVGQANDSFVNKFFSQTLLLPLEYIYIFQSPHMSSLKMQPNAAAKVFIVLPKKADSEVSFLGRK